MIIKYFFAALWALSFEVGFVHGSPAGKADIVQKVACILKDLHASSFCSSFAPQSTVVVSSNFKSKFHKGMAHYYSYYDRIDDDPYNIEHIGNEHRTFRTLVYFHKNISDRCRISLLLWSQKL
jgi:hypothetical protein